MTKWQELLTLWEASCWLGIGKLMLLYMQIRRAILGVLIVFLRWLSKEE